MSSIVDPELTRGHSIETRPSVAEFSVEEVLQSFGRVSFPIILIVLALIALSPLSIIPGIPTLMGLFVAVIGGQMLLNLPHVIMPRKAMELKFSSGRLHQFLGWLYKITVPSSSAKLKGMDWLLTRPFIVFPQILIVLCGMSLFLMSGTASSVACVSILGLSAAILLRSGVLVVVGSFAFSLAATIWIL